MIQTSSIDAAYTLGENLAREGKELTAVEATPLHELVTYSKPISEDVVSDNGERPEPFNQIEDASRQKNAEGVSLHDVTMDEVVAIVSKTVARNIDMARNIVNPLVRQCVEGVEEEMGRVETGALQPIRVVTDHYALVWNNPLLETLVSNYADMPVAEITAVAGLPEMTAEALRESVLTGVSRLDPDIEKLLDDMGAARLEQIYSQALAGREGLTENGLITFTLMTRHPDQFRDDILILHLLSKRLLRNVPEGTSGDLDVYRDQMSNVLAQTGRLAVRCFERRAHNRRIRRLVNYSGVPTDLDFLTAISADILVNGDVYNNWLAEGGSPEILFGAAITDRETGYKALLDGAERYQEAWKRQTRILATHARFNRFNALLGAMTRTMTRIINGLDDELLVVGREELHGRLKNFLPRVNAKDAEDLYCLARKAVCRILFPHTDVEYILSAIDAAATAEENLEIREAALLATIELVTDWVVDLIAVRSIA